MITELEYQKRLKWTLSQKVDHAFGVIDEFYSHEKGKVYVSFSGGKDSTVLLYLVRKLFPEVKGVFIDTGLEFPEIRDFVKKQENIEWVKPKLTFLDVIEKYGYPVISKIQSFYIEQYRNTKSEKLKLIRWKGRYDNTNKSYQYSINPTWKFMVKAPFKISDKCCHVLKKQPSHKFEIKSGLAPIIGTMAIESYQRKTDYLKTGCNILEGKRVISKPLSIWTTNDIWNFIRKYKIPYSEIYNMGQDRTGCTFCLFGIHMEQNPNRFQRMQNTHPALYKYCLQKLGIQKVLEYMKIPYIYSGEQQQFFKNDRT